MINLKSVKNEILKNKEHFKSEPRLTAEDINTFRNDLSILSISTIERIFDLYKDWEDKNV
jgi:hypothetical protein